MAHPTCQVGGRFSRCHGAAQYDCQYCGRAFCAEHAYFVEGHEAVCSRKSCATKRDDLAQHLEYRRGVERRNNAGLCGIDGCGPHPGFECSLCRGLFCGDHLTERMYPFRMGMATIDRPVSICAACWDRRKIWRAA
ncbi:hypothetical protein J0H33_00565 [bacterium]|nr:hypothetical protein [bacterium]